MKRRRANKLLLLFCRKGRKKRVIYGLPCCAWSEMNKNGGYGMRGLILVLALCAGAANAGGKAVAGVLLPEQIRLQGVQQPLRLNGAGIRYKLFFKIYVGALYLPRPQHEAAALLSDPPANRVLMHFLYDEVSKEKLDDAWDEGFGDNLDAQALAALKDRIERFKGMFRTLREGDEVWLDYVPDRGTRVTINGEQQGVIGGKDFNTALLSVWLGREPVTQSLKKALLSADEE